MIKTLISRLRNFKEGQKGGVLIFVAICILPLLLVVGLAVDSSFGLLQKRKLQMAVDAAAKAGSAYGNSSSGTVAVEAGIMFSSQTASMSGTISGPNVSYNSTTGCVTVSASISVPTNFMVLGGIPSVTYNARSSACQSGNKTEVAIVFDLSNTNGNWTSKMINSLQGFVTSIPPTTLVSIVPITTQIALDPTNTIQNSLFSHLSNTTNDESANPAFYPLSSNYTWNSTNYGSVYNYLYGNNFPISSSYYPSPGTCTGWGGPGTYLACSAFYPSLCSVGRTSCRANYSYTSRSLPPILPLTAKQSILSNYLTTLGNYDKNNPDIFPSLIIWGWRTIAPEWRDFWLVNSDSTNASRSSGTYPSAYTNSKNIILVMTGGTTWGASSLANTYNTQCGAGTTKWQMTYYGVFPMTSDRSAYIDITCDNYNYKTIDQTLGLNLTTTNSYASTQTSTQYGTKVVTELDAKLLRTCSNIKAKGINIYVITQNDNPNLKQCATSTIAPYYQVTGNGVPFINVASANVANNLDGPSTVQGGP